MPDFRCARSRKEASFRLAVRLVGRMGRLKGRMVGAERVDFHPGRVEAGVAVDAAGVVGPGLGRRGWKSWPGISGRSNLR